MTYALKVSEKDFQRTVVELALHLGYAVHHTIDQKHYAKRIGPGFPDLTLVHPQQRRVIFAELKSSTGKLSEAQKWWADILSKCPGVEYFLWKPSDINEAEAALRG